MLKLFKNRIHQEIDALFATAEVDAAAGHMDDYREKLEQIARICEVLGIETRVREVFIDFK
jgi:hypothetical protein